MRARPLRRNSAVALTLGCLLVTACGIGDKAELEELITGAPERFGSENVRGVLRVESRLLEAPTGAGIGGAAAPAGGQRPELPEDGLPLQSAQRAFSVDVAASRASLTPEGGSRPTVLIEDLVWFGRRAGVPDDDARPWARLDLADLAEDAGEIQPFSEQAAAAIAALHPAIVIDLAAGALTGSIERLGAETVAGVETTRYGANFAIDKALGDVRRRRYPEDRRERVDELVELLGIDGEVHPGEVWLDADGRIRRLTLRLVQRPATRVELAMVVTLEVTEIGGAYLAEPPTPQQVLSVDSVVRFVTTVGAGAPAAPPAPGEGEGA